MNHQEFEKKRKEIESEKLAAGDMDPIAFGIRRAVFDQEKFSRLIQLSKKSKMKTAQTKAQQWRRQLEKSHESQRRFERLRESQSAPAPIRDPAPSQPQSQLR